MKTLKTTFLASLGLLPYQIAWLRDESQFKIGLWARQTGKDYTCAAEAAIDCFERPGSHWIIVAASERQARESLQKADAWLRRLCHQSETGLAFPGSPAITSSAREVRLDNGSRITALPGKAGTIRGFSANLILTEFAFHDDPEKLWSAIFPTISNSAHGQKRLRIITTPNGQGTFFHRLWRDSAFGKHLVTVHDASQQGLPLDIAALRQGISDPEAWSQEYECQFTDASSVLLPFELIETAISPDATQTLDPDHLSRTTGELFLGIDFGRHHDLTVCWMLQKIPTAGGAHSTAPHSSSLLSPLSPVNCSPSPSVPSAFCSVFLLTREVLELRRMPTPDQFRYLQPRVARARRVCLDATGAGIGLGDLLVQQFRNKIELCSFTPALKQELFPKLRSAFERGLIKIPRTREITEDLHGIQRVVSTEGHISYRAAETRDGHSDRCTALALALRAAETSPVVAMPSILGESFKCTR